MYGKNTGIAAKDVIGNHLFFVFWLVSSNSTKKSLQNFRTCGIGKEFIFKKGAKRPALREC